MTVVIFAFGIFVFLITVYGSVVAGGLLLTGRQLDEQPELVPEASDQRDDIGTDIGGPRSLIPLEY